MFKDNFEEMFDEVVNENEIYELVKEGEPKAVLISWGHYQELVGKANA